MANRPDNVRSVPTQPLDPFEVGVLEELHAQKRFAQRNSHLEYGKVLRVALEEKLGFECGNYVRRIDRVARTEASSEWVLLRPLLPARGWESELFDWVVGLDADQLALTNGGEWLVRSDVAVNLLIDQRDSQKRARSETSNFLLIFAITAVAAIAIVILFG
jgi:hypothetical protein